MEPGKSPLSDLSFFRFPAVTADTVRHILLLVLLLALTVLATVWVQRRTQRRQRERAQREAFDRFSDEQRLDPPGQAVLGRLMELAQARDEFAFVHDAEAFERAVDTLAAADDDATLAALARLRRTLHLNVMNPETQLVSTRQLLEDLPVRLMASTDGEKLDLYCALLKVDERALLISLPQEDDLSELLLESPQVFLLFWRERDGETVFRVELEPVAAGRFPALRARHAFRDADAERSTFRLSLDVPAHYQCLERQEPGWRRGRGESQRLHEGEARVIDVSYGGASLLAPEPLPEHGLTQLAFELQGQPLRLMLEILSCAPGAGGQSLIRGQIRGLGEEARARLNKVLYREQIKRLRGKQLLRTPAVS